jgi:hypothetical protein
MKLTTECGQRWYSLHSWRVCQPRFRRLRDVGIAFGPIMFFWRWS